MGQRFKRLADRLGIDAHLHTLRHYAATELFTPASTCERSPAASAMVTAVSRCGTTPRGSLGQWCRWLLAAATAPASGTERAAERSIRTAAALAEHRRYYVPNEEVRDRWMRAASLASAIAHPAAPGESPGMPVWVKIILV
jgi:hypothetical protein